MKMRASARIVHRYSGGDYLFQFSIWGKAMRKYRFSGLTAAALAVALTLTPSASLWANADQEAGAPAGEGNADNLDNAANADNAANPDGAPAGGDLGDAADEGEEGGLIEDNGQDVSIEGGLDYESVQAAIAAENAARNQVQTLIDDPQVTLLAADEKNISDYLRNLTAEVNPTGSYEEMDIASYIEDTLSSWGYSVSEQNFHEGVRDENGIDQPGVNILAERGPDGDERSDRILILTAHYDAKRQEDSDKDKKLFAAEIAAQASEKASGDAEENISEAASETEERTQAYSRTRDPLANDKNGAAVLMETARILADIDSNIDVAFVFLSGEEDGYYGSSAFVQSLEEETRQKVAGVICVDRVGYGDDTVPVLLGTSDGLANEPAGMLEAAAEKLAMKTEVLTTDEPGAEAGTEAGTEAALDTVTEKADSAGQDAAVEWSVSKADLGTAQNFIAWTLPTVSVSQDENSIYRWYTAAEDAEVTAERAQDAEQTTESTQDADNTSEDGSEETSAAASSVDADTLTNLAGITDVIANAAAAYMKPDKSGLGTIPPAEG